MMSFEACTMAAWGPLSIFFTLRFILRVCILSFSFRTFALSSSDNGLFSLAGTTTSLAATLCTSTAATTITTTTRQATNVQMAPSN
mmetsp:Transcript_51931/g.76970  ORF Transcript_51931/g.76970 Transcript_51931/m.76970 type:complete len:86 (-) Transcript_51931:42-299(-)